MKDFSIVFGSIPLPPRYAFGIWWTRWLDYNDRDLQNIFTLHKQSSIPMDVCVLDMNWHKKNVKFFSYYSDVGRLYLRSKSISQPI